MVSRELSLSFANDENTLENHLENLNPSYKRAREIYSTLLGKTANPLLKDGLASNKESFLIILLEKILRNTELILEQNNSLKDKVQIIEEDILQLKNDGLDPIVQAGNKITTELKLFELGFKNWNTKFEKFQEIFDNWNTGFKDFEEHFTKLETFLKDFSRYWVEKTETIQRNLNKIEQHITQWNHEVIGINTSVDNLQKRYIDFQQRQTHLVQPRTLIQTSEQLATTSSSDKQTFQVLPSHNHQWKL